MALSRRSSNRVTANIWPGFVDAVTSLLMVMTFVLTIFIVVQFVLREEISGQESQLDELNMELTNLARALGAATDRADRLAGERDTLSAEADRRDEVITSLQNRLGDQSAQIASFEEQVASLLVARDEDRAQIAGLQDERDAAQDRAAQLVSEQEALNLALAQARDEIDSATEEARLAAARREALQALIASLEIEAEQANQTIAGLEDTISASDARAASLEDELSEEEVARMTEAAAAEALRARLQESDAELTAMSLALEEQRREAEETLTLLAAAETAQADLNDRLLAALLARDEAAARSAELAEESETLRATLDETQERAAELGAAEENLAAARTAEEAARQRADRSAALLQEALAQQDAQTRELASISDALDAARAARLAFQGDLEDARAELAAAKSEVAQLRAEAGREADERDRLAAELAAAQSEAEALDAARSGQADLRAQLEQALALKLAAENRSQESLDEAERREALLATARDRLSEEQELTAAQQREVAALNAQVADLRNQLGSLQALLDAADDADAESAARIETLGTQLNAALAREALEQRRRAELEAAERQRLETYQSEFFGRLREVLGDREGVQIVGDRFVFSSEVLFPSGSANLSTAGREQVRRVANLLEEVADEIPENIDWVIRVDGHTDDVPISGDAEFDDNWELSQARALSVVRFMADELGFPEWRLAPTGFGEYRPVDPRTTPAARAANRRIELKLTER